MKKQDDEEYQIKKMVESTYILTVIIIATLIMFLKIDFYLKMFLIWFVFPMALLILFFSFVFTYVNFLFFPTVYKLTIAFVIRVTVTIFTSKMVANIINNYYSKILDKTLF